MEQRYLREGGGGVSGGKSSWKPPSDFKPNDYKAVHVYEITDSVIDACSWEDVQEFWKSPATDAAPALPYPKGILISKRK